MKPFIYNIYGFNEINDEKNLLGIGFILQSNYFITAAHVVSDEYAKKFKYFLISMGDDIEILPKPFYLKFEKDYFDKDELYHDLAIYKISTNDNSFYATTKTSMSKNFKLNHFNYYNKEIEEIKVIQNNFAMKLDKYSNVIKMRNCFQVNKLLDSGDSGSPLFIDNIVYGMVTYAFNKNRKNHTSLSYTIAIKSSYILEVIQNVEM